MISGFIAGLIIGAVGALLIIKQNPKLQAYFNIFADKAEKIIEEKTGKDI